MTNCLQGLQVAPAELEAHLLSHEYVDDCCVIGVPDDRAGELPKAYIVANSEIAFELSKRAIQRTIARHVEKEKSKLRSGEKNFHDKVFEEEVKELINTTYKHYEAYVLRCETISVNADITGM